MGLRENYFEAIESGSEQRAIDLLNEHNFDPDLRERLGGGATALALAARTGKDALLAELIRRGGNVNMHDGTLAPIHMALNASTAKLLIDAGADVNVGWKKEGIELAKGTTALHTAARSGDAAMVDLLLSAGADPNARDADGRTPLHSGSMNPEIVDKLLGAGANIDARMRNGQSAQDLIEHFSKPVSPTVASVAAAPVSDSEPQSVIREADARQQVQAAAAPEADYSAKSAYLAASRGDAEPVEDKPARPITTPGELVEEETRNVIRQVNPQLKTLEATAAASTDDNSTPLRIRPAGEQQTPEQQKPAAKTLLGGRFIGDENGNYRRPGEKAISLRDENNEIVLTDKQMDTFMAGLELAKSKGWSAIEVEGSQRFRREAWFHGQREGMEVVGYEPTSKDLDTLAQMLERSTADQIAPGVSASLEAAKELVVSEGKGFVAPNYENGNYAGTVLGETDHHFIVSVDGREGTATAIEKDRLDGVSVKPNELLKVRFQGGKPVQTQARDQSRSMSR
ncbi:ankyrin repeat domain-containing protein [Paraburkholderia sp. A1RI-2L]|uniref:ankyrin repeat domain-containing protein n=1 Tax=Paraburkholderia sp. A1RI-2L TaxID=3028367 RepID=UPI003B7BB821